MTTTALTTPEGRAARRKAAAVARRAANAEARRRETAPLLARAALVKMRPVSGVKLNPGTGRPDWTLARRRPRLAFALVRRLAEVIRFGPAVRLCREFAGCDLGAAGVAGVPWIEPLILVDEPTIERVAAAARYAGHLAKSPTPLADAKRLADRGGVARKQVTADAGLWDGRDWSAIVRAEEKRIAAERKVAEAAHAAGAAERKEKKQAAARRATAMAAAKQKYLSTHEGKNP